MNRLQYRKKKRGKRKISYREEFEIGIKRGAKPIKAGKSLIFMMDKPKITKKQRRVWKHKWSKFTEAEKQNVLKGY